jgi:Tol biopolymer transport system component
MRKTLIPLLVACMAAGPWASASPQPPPIQLWVMEADGTNQRQVGDDDQNYGVYRGFSWSPDSSRIVSNGLTIVNVSTGTSVMAGTGTDPDWSITDEIVFVDRGPSDDGTALYVMDGTGEARRVLLDLPVGQSNPAWSPDGRQVAFVAGAGSGEAAQVFVVDSDGTDARQLTTAGSKYIDPTWSPDGRTIAFETFDSELYLVNVDGTGERPVGDHDYSSQPTWCPDGTLYYTGQNPNEVARIYALNPSGEETTVTQGSAANCGPDGRLAFSRDGDVHVVTPGAPGEPNLTASADRADFDASWAPDGSKMAFLSLPHLPDPTPLPRTMSMSLRDHVVARGRLDPAPSQNGCSDYVRVQKITEQGWRKVDLVRVGTDGRFRAELPDRAGLYRAVADRHFAPYGTYECLRAVSEIVRHRH